MRKMSLTLTLLGVLTLVAAGTGLAADGFRVHEWGTFTSLQDEQGRSLAGINVDDEPVPDFVHNLHPFLLGKPFLSSHHWVYRQKAAPRRHPYVTMRLETPVIYFHPSADAPKPFPVDVQVRFRGGWLTEFYPAAKADAPGLKQGDFRFGELTSQTESRLTWSQVLVGEQGAIPETKAPVWLAPRATSAAPVTVGEESEKYLFYRGVARIDAPLRVTMDREQQSLNIFGNIPKELLGGGAARIPALWLVDIRPEGTSAFRPLQSVSVAGDRQELLANTSYTFQAEDYAERNLSELKAEMHDALVADGLFDDEAAALLTTWQRAYFKSPGLRLFFLVPRVWTDHYLPLSLSRPAEIERVMVGRIELITADQRRLLSELESGPISNGEWIRQIPESEAKDRFLAGRHDFDDLGVTIPSDYQSYLDMGRFRNSLILDRQSRKPSQSLAKFIRVNRLQPFTPP